MPSPASVYAIRRGALPREPMRQALDPSSHSRRAAPSGFTLIELLVVIIVLGMLAALVGPRILGRVSEAKSATAKTQIELLGTALDSARRRGVGNVNHRSGSPAVLTDRR